MLITQISIGQISPKKFNGKWGYVNANKEWVVKPKLEMATKFVNGYSAFKKKGKWGFVDELGNIRIKPKYRAVREFHEDLCAAAIVVDQYVLWGYLDRQGFWKIAPSYKEAGKFTNGLAIIKTVDSKSEKHIINNEGAIVSEPFLKIEKTKSGLFYLRNKRDDGKKVFSYSGEDGKPITRWYLNEFKLNDGIKRMTCATKEGNKTKIGNGLTGSTKQTLIVVIDESGKEISEPYEYLGKFNDGFCIAQVNSKWGVIDQNYKRYTEFKYSEITTLDDNRLVGRLPEGTFILMTLKGEELGKYHSGYESFDDPKYILGRHEIPEPGNRHFKKALFDTLGNQYSGWYSRIEPKQNIFYRAINLMDYQDANDEHQQGHFYNYMVDTSLLMICKSWRKSASIDVQLESRTFRDSVFSRYYNPKSKYPIDETFYKEMLKLELDWSKNKVVFNGGDFHEGMAMVSEIQNQERNDTLNGVIFSGKKLTFGFINWNGKQVIPCRYEFVSGFSDGKAIFRQNNKFGAIDYRGRVVMRPKYEIMGVFGDGLAPVYIDSAWFYTNVKGQIQIKEPYDDARPYNYGYAAVKKGRKWGLIDTQGRQVLDFKYRKPPVVMRNERVRILKDGIGYVEEDISSLR